MPVEQDPVRQPFRVTGQAFVDKARELIHEGNVRRLVIKDDQGYPVLAFPVTAGVVAAVVAPVVTAIAATATLAEKWSIEVEHNEPLASPEGGQWGARRQA